MYLTAIMFIPFEDIEIELLLLFIILEAVSLNLLLLSIWLAVVLIRLYAYGRLKVKLLFIFCVDTVIESTELLFILLEDLLEAQVAILRGSYGMWKPEKNF